MTSANRTWTAMAVLAVCLATAASPLRPQQPNVAVREQSSDAVKIAVIEERLRGMQIALDLQAAKYEDRLLALNHAHDKQVSDQATYLAKDSFEATIKGWEEWRTATEKRLTIIEASALGGSTFRSNALVTIMAGVALAGFFMLWFTRRREREHAPPPGR